MPKTKISKTLERLSCEYGSLTANEYSKKVVLPNWQPESLFIKTVKEYFGDTRLCNVPFLQTAPHLGFTLSDRMLTIVWLTHLMTPKEHPVYIGACSGIPLSNSYLPGRIYSQDGEHNLAPARYQNALLSSATSDILAIERIPKKYKSIITTNIADSLSETMSKVLSKVLSDWLKREVIVFPLNELTTQLITLDDPLWRDILQKHEEPVALSSYKSGKYEKTDTIYYKDGIWKGKRVSFGTLESMLLAFKERRATPSSWLMYAALAHVANIPVAGSYFFAEYYRAYVDRWKKQGIKTDGAHVVTTGTHPNIKGKSSWDAWNAKKQGDQLDITVTMEKLFNNIT